MKPILFNTDMARAILANRKTVTRRVVKPQPEESSHSPYECVGGRFAFRIGERACTNQYKPTYRPGNILYVRETFRVDYLSNIPGSGRIHYKADDTYRNFTFAPERYEMMRRAQLKPGWRSSENMPKEAARLFLRVTEVRVERLHYITRDEAVREGANPALAVDDFKRIWDSTIRKSDLAFYGWKANPYVWVIEFERINKEEAER